MTENYFNVKKKLEDLGYNHNLPLEAVTLVECVLADLLQTTRSLQHYMDLSKEVIIQRDKLVLELEPYRCDNAKLIQENNQLHKDLMITKEEIEKINKFCKRKTNSLSEELVKKDATISRLQHEIRDLSLRGLCAETHSSRNKSKRRDCGDDNKQRSNYLCSDNRSLDVENELLEMTKKIKALEENNISYADEILLLKNQVEYRDNEIIRLNIMLEGGRPPCVNIDNRYSTSDTIVHDLMKQLSELESTNELLRKEIDNGLEKQHEAMLRALSLADKNNCLKEELAKVDSLALSVEEDCNKKLSSMMNEVNMIQNKLDHMLTKNIHLESILSSRQRNEPSFNIVNMQESLNKALIEKDAMQQELRNLQDVNKRLQEQNKLLSELQKKDIEIDNFKYNHSNSNAKNIKYATTDDMQKLLESERSMYEKHMTGIQEKLSDTIKLFEKHLSRCKNKDVSISPGNLFIKELHNKLCESEQKILLLKKENDALQDKINNLEDNGRQNYKDVVKQLNSENSELLKENLALSRQLSQYKTTSSIQSCHHSDVDKMQKLIQQLKCENQLANKDKQEYKMRYKETMDVVENMKRDLILKQKQVEQLEEENCSYKMTNRSGKASSEHLKEECNFLREQIKRLQTDVIKEKTMNSQIKNIHIETERSSTEIHNELINTQKQLSVSKTTIESLEHKCKSLQLEISSLKSDKINLIDNIKKVDKERDHLVIELDHKTEAVFALEKKLKSHVYEIEKYENELTDLKKKLNSNKVSEHKLIDNDAQIKFLNGEILRITQQFDNAVIENKQLQNSLADINGTLKLTKMEYEKSRKEVDSLKLQLQHYVAEIRRIEELLSHKEAERSDMLENFASLSVEANILENTNHSLESESASKSLQLQNYISKICDLESKLLDKDNIVDNQAARLASMNCKITALESEVKLITEEKEILEKNISYLKQMCHNLQSEKQIIVKGVDDTDSELMLYENKIKTLSKNKAQLEADKLELKERLQSVEKLFSNSRREVVELKLALQDATTETKSLQDQIAVLNRQDSFQETSRVLDVPITLEDITHEEILGDDCRFHEINRRLSKYSRSGTL